MDKLIAKADTLIEALPYIQRFKDSIFVVKYGGSFMDDPDPVVRSRLALDIVFLASVGIKVVVVHGGGKAITRAMERSGIQANFINGLRVTDEATVKIVKDTLNGEVNMEICEQIMSFDGRPLSIAGNNVLQCRKAKTFDDKGNEIDLGFVGEVKNVHTAPIIDALNKGFIPVISPIAVDPQGHDYNTNADVAAAAVAGALHARRLVFLSDVPGLLSDPKSEKSLLSSLKVNDVEGLKKSGVISKGMLPKIDSAIKALEDGVRRVHLIDARMAHSILLEIFTDKGIGTEILV